MFKRKACCVALAIAAFYILTAGPFYVLGVDVTYNGIADLLWAAAGLVVLLLYGLAIWNLFPKSFNKLRQKMSWTGRLPIPGIMLLALASGIAEEIVFRGFLQPKVGIVIASVVFGLVHQCKGARMWSVFAIGAGFILGWVTIESGSLMPAMIAHSLNNFISIMLLYRRNSRESKKSEEWAARLNSDGPLPADLQEAKNKLLEVDRRIAELRAEHQQLLESQEVSS